MRTVNDFLFARALNICCGHKKGSDFFQKHFVSATNFFPVCAARKQKHISFVEVQFVCSTRKFTMSNNGSSFGTAFTPKIFFLSFILLDRFRIEEKFNACLFPQVSNLHQRTSSDLKSLV